MRRPAPDAPPSKRLRTDCEDGEAKSFMELGRFDYRAAEQLAQGAQGFIVTCGFQRCWKSDFNLNLPICQFQLTTKCQFPDPIFPIACMCAESKYALLCQLCCALLWDMYMAASLWR